MKRAGCVIMARLAVKNKKAINWALRQVGKRNLNLNKKAIEVAKEIQKINSKSAKWIAQDAVRESIDEKIQKRL